MMDPKVQLGVTAQTSMLEQNILHYFNIGSGKIKM